MDSQDVEKSGVPSNIIAYNDPKTVFFINPSTLSSEEAKSQLATFYLWAVKAENTVEKQLGHGNRGTLEESWARSSYRAKLVDYLAKTTPWLSLKDQEDHDTTLSFEGSYDHDKNLYQQTVRKILLRRIPQIPAHKLSCIESFIAETALMCRQEVTKPVRFALVMPTPVQPSDSAASNGPGICVITFIFEVQDGGKMAAVSQSVYECGVDLKLFDQQKLDPQELAAGRAIVDYSTVDLIL